MQTTNKYMYFKSAIDEKTCKQIISYGLSKMQIAESEGFSKNASTFDGKEKGGTDSKGKKTSKKLNTAGMNKQTLKKKGIDVSKAYVRDSHISWLNDKWLYDIFHPYVKQANDKSGWGWQWDFSESFQFTVYHGHPKQGQFYGWHADGQSDWPGAYKPAINVGTENIIGLIVANTHTDDVGFDLILGDPSLAGSTATTDEIGRASCRERV